MIVAQLEGGLSAHPDLAEYHSIFDLRQHTGRIGIEGMQRIVAFRLEATANRRPVQSVLLVQDAGMVFTARYLDHLVPHIVHSVTADPEEALARATGLPVLPAAPDFLAAP
jgi:hypothetical protein